MPDIANPHEAAKSAAADVAASFAANEGETQLDTAEASFQDGQNAAGLYMDDIPPGQPTPASPPDAASATSVSVCLE